MMGLRSFPFTLFCHILTRKRGVRERQKGGGEERETEKDGERWRCATPAKTFSISPTISCVITDAVWWCFNDRDLPVTVTLCVCVWGRVRVCVCWGNLAGPVDDGRVMRWSRAVEIRPVCPQRLPPTRHTHTHTLKASSINTPPSPPTHQTTPQCHLLSHQHTHHTLTNPPPTSPSYPHLSTLWSSVPRWQPSAPPTVWRSMRRYL